MPVPSPRNSIRIARGLYADLAANATEIGEGELCFAIDQDKFYSKAGTNLIAVGGGTELASIAQLGDVDIAGATNGQVLVYNSATGVWTSQDPAETGGDVQSVNGQTGVVILTVSDLANDAGYITAAEAPVQPGDVFSGDYNDLTNKPSIPPAYDDSALDARVTQNESDIAQLETDLNNIDGFSGDYNDLTNKPSIPSTPADIGAATAAQGAKADSAIQPGTVNPVYFANQAAFPDPVANHGAVAHSHADGAMYFAHAGVWNKMANDSDIPTNVSELNNDAGYLTTETVNNISLAALPLLP